MITDDQWEEWKANPVTIAFTKAIKALQEEQRKNKIYSHGRDVNLDSVALKAAYHEGIIEALERVLDVRSGGVE